MKTIFLTLTFAFGFLFANAQFPATTFPVGWEGNWKGTLDWLRPSGEPMQVYHELQIESNFSQDTVLFTIIYGEDKSDVRQYKMIKQSDHWVMDEQNSILIQCWFVGNRLVNLFEVETSMLFVQYELNDIELTVEMFTFSTASPWVTGGSSNDVPAVTSYPLKAVSRAVLRLD